MKIAGLSYLITFEKQILKSFRKVFEQFIYGNGIQLVSL